MTIFVGNTSVLELKGLYDEVNAAFINNAVVGVTIYDKDGIEVSGETWPLTMDYVAASDGIYRVFLSGNIEFVAGACYTAKITGTGAGIMFEWDFHFIPLERRN